MANGYEFLLSGGLKQDGDFERQLPEVIADAEGFDFEEYWHRLEVDAAGSQVITADVLDNARVIVVLGAEGISVTFGSTGTDPIPANPFLFIADETDGTGFDQLTISNDSSREQKVTIIACSYKT